MKCPADFLFECLCLRFADVVQECRHSQPEIVRHCSNFIHNLQRMQENIFVVKIIPLVYTRQLLHFRKNNPHNPGVVHQLKPDGWFIPRHDFQKFFRDAFLRNYCQPLRHFSCCFHHIRLNGKSKLRGKTYRAHNAERVVIECDFRIERCAQNSFPQVICTIERIGYFAEGFFIETCRHGIHGKIPTRQIFFECPCFNNRITGIFPVTFLACADKFQFPVVQRQHRRTEVFKENQIRFTEFLCDYFCKLYTAADDNDIRIFDLLPKQKIAHIAADNVRGNILTVCDNADTFENFILYIDMFFCCHYGAIRPM